MNAAPARRDLAQEVGAIVRAAWPAMVASVVLGAAFVALVPAGLPYDEPAHWANVEFYLEQHRMPELGEVGASYEAQMGPVAYLLYALVAAPFHLFGLEVAGFYASRALGIVLLLALATGLAVVAQRVLRPHRGIALLVVAAAGLNPMLLAVATSIQNDVLALLLGTAALVCCLDAGRGRVAGSARRAVLVGVLLALALLTKVTAWPFVVAIGLVLLWRRRWRDLAITAGVTAALSSWWFVRNLLLYGDLTARAGVEAAGFEFPPLGDASAVALVKSAATYLWLPTEYVRNAIAAPWAIDLIVIVLCVILACGAVTMARRLTRPRVMAVTVTGIAVAAVAAWAIVALASQAVAFRTAYASLLLVYTALGALVFWGPRRAFAMVVVPLVIIAGWFLVEVASLPDPMTWIEW